MIKSKFWSFGFFIIGGVSVFFFLMWISATSQIYFGRPFLIKFGSPDNMRSMHFNFALSLIVTLLFSSVFVSNANIINIDVANKTISLKGLFARKKLYAFDQIDGYIQTEQRDGAGSTYRVIYLVKGDKYIARITNFFCSNFGELREGLSDLKYLGFKHFNIIDSFKVLLGLPIYHQESKF